MESNQQPAINRRLKMQRPKVEKRKQSVYMRTELLEEITAEAKRQERSLSWIIQKTWELAREEIGKLPTVPEKESGKDSGKGSDE